jgi:hypothetical protein
MVTMQSGTKYAVEPDVLAKIASTMSEAIKYTSLAMRNIPHEESLTQLSKLYEYEKVDDNIGVGFEMDATLDVDGEENLELTNLVTPTAYTNMSITYNDYLLFQQSKLSLSERLMRRVNRIARRIDLITYIGDTKFSINALGTATPGTEITTPLNVTTPTLAQSTFASAFSEMKVAGKYGGLVTPSTNVIIECTPNIYALMQGNTTATEDQNVLAAVERLVTQTFGSGSKVVENPYLDGSYTVDANGKASISVGTNGILMYPQHPMVMKTVGSPLEIRQSNLDQVKGITFQPIQRHTRVDDDNGKATILVETGPVTS